MVNCKRRVRTNRTGFHWVCRKALESWRERLPDVLKIDPLRQNSGDLFVILLGDEIVEARVRFGEHGFERSLSAIVRVKMQRRRGDLGA